MNNDSPDGEKINVKYEDSQSTPQTENNLQSIANPEAASTNTLPNSKRKRLFLVLGLFLILIVVAATIIYKNQHKPATSTAGNINNVALQNSTTNDSLDTLLYALRPNNTSAFTLYWQPISGGTKNEALKLSNVNDYPYINDIRGQKLLINMTDGLYISQDAGRTYKKIYNLTTSSDTTQAITGAIFTTDGQKIAFGYNDGTGHGNKVSLMNLDGSSQVALWSDVAAGVFLKSYNTATNIALYQVGCYFCDGAPSELRQMNTATKATQSLFTIDTSTVLDTVTVSNDGSKAFYITGVSDETLRAAAGGPGWAGGPPYTLREIDLASGKTTTISTIGSLHQKDSAGKYTSYYFQSRYIKDSTDPWYSYDNNLYVVKNGAPSLVFQSINPINSAELVSNKTVLVSVNNSKDSSSDSTLYSYDINSKKMTKLLDLNANVSLLGVTTK